MDPLVVHHFDPYDIRGGLTIAYNILNENSVEYAYSLCSLKDCYSKKTGKQICFDRLASKGSTYGVLDSCKLFSFIFGYLNLPSSSIHDDDCYHYYSSVITRMRTNRIFGTFKILKAAVFRSYPTYYEYNKSTINMGLIMNILHNYLNYGQYENETMYYCLDLFNTLYGLKYDVLSHLNVGTSYYFE